MAPTRQQPSGPSRQGEVRERVNPLPGLVDWRIGGKEPRARSLHAMRPEASADCGQGPIGRNPGSEETEIDSMVEGKGCGPVRRIGDRAGNWAAVSGSPGPAEQAAVRQKPGNLDSIYLQSISVLEQRLLSPCILLIMDLGL